MIIINPGLPTSRYLNMVHIIRKNDVLNNSSEGNNHYKWCSKCKIYTLRRDNVEHCDLCNICILNYDHHCYFSGKCVGRYNLVPFYIYGISALIILFSDFFLFLSGITRLFRTK